MKRVVMIGIDGLDADLLRVYGPSLPHIRQLMLESPFLELQSTFPPQANIACASVYTGLNPGNHGILGGDCWRRSAPDTLPDYNSLQGETFWDIAGQAGKRVCVIQSLLPSPWPVNGIMLSSSAMDSKGLGRQPASLCAELERRTVQQAEDGLELFHREPWDLFCLQLDALDYAQHVLWRYSDHGDASYPGRNQHSERILNFYHLFDTIIGYFRSAMENDGVLLVVSNYGHGRSCTTYLNLNEWLRTQHMLTALPRLRSPGNFRYLAAGTEHRLKALWTRFSRQSILPHPSLGGKRASSSAAYLLNQQETMAQVVELGEASSFGGIMLNRTCIERKGEAYEAVRASLLHSLTQLRFNERPVVRWAKAREHVYQGTYIEWYPDILFELHSDIGTSNRVHVPLITRNATHQYISGDHRMHGVFLAGNLPACSTVVESVKEPTVMDVAPTISSLLDVAGTHYDGQSLILLPVPMLMP